MEREHDPPTSEEQSWTEASQQAGAGVKLCDGMRSVHTQFIRAVLVCLAFVAVCYPRLSDKPRAAALRDLGELSQHVDVEALEQRLAKDAERKLAPDLTRLKRMVGLQRVQVANESQGQSHLLVAERPDLSSLHALALAARPNAQVTVRGPSLEALASSLRWRLDLTPGRGQLTLTRLTVSHPVSAKNLETEVRVALARAASERAFEAHERSRRTYFEIRDATSKLSARSSKKALAAATRDRVKAWEDFERTQGTLETARAEYARSAQEALKSPLDRDPGRASPGVLMRATLQAENGETLELTIPVPLEIQHTVAPANVPTALVRLEDSPIWPEIQALTPQAATAYLREQLSWHAKEATVLGVPLRGAMVLEAVPLLICLMMGLLIWRCRAVLRAYSPFGNHADIEIPSPGSGRPTLDSVLLIAPASLVCLLSCWALLRLDLQPWVTVALSAVAIAQCVLSARALKDLESIRAVVRHRSLVPPLPVRQSLAG